MKIISWNVNGIRAAARKGFQKWLEASDAAVVCIQEVRAHLEQIPVGLRRPEGWHSHFVAGVRKGYSGVGLYSRHQPGQIETSMGVPHFDDEGRLQLFSLGDLLIANFYFPNGSGRDRDNSRVPYKIQFYQRLFQMLEVDFLSGRPILVLGDFNTAHEEIDLARPRQNQKTSGFLLEEREEFDRWLRAGWLDTFRHYHPHEPGHYTWWRQWGDTRRKNIGWRIDYVLASPGAVPYIQKAFIWPHVMGSDHCPIGIVIDPDVCTARSEF